MVESGGIRRLGVVRYRRPHRGNSVRVMLVPSRVQAPSLPLSCRVFVILTAPVSRVLLLIPRTHREETSNNRIRSGPRPKRGAPRPIDQVPGAGARQGLSNGVETTEAGLGIVDLEDPERSPALRPLSISSGSSSRTLRASTLTVDTVLFPRPGDAPLSPGGSLHTPTSARLFSPNSPNL